LVAAAVTQYIWPQMHWLVTKSEQSHESPICLVGVADLGQVQASIAPAYVAAHEQRAVGLAQRAEAVGNARERADHAARVEPAATE
jgi:hypothetical protein